MFLPATLCQIVIGRYPAIHDLSVMFFLTSMQRCNNFFFKLIAYCDVIFFLIIANSFATIVLCIVLKRS